MEALNLDSFTNPEEVLEAMRPASGKGSRLLRRYATCKAAAMRCRIVGSAIAAQVYEDMCERIYQKLPKNLKW